MRRFVDPNQCAPSRFFYRNLSKLCRCENSAENAVGFQDEDDEGIKACSVQRITKEEIPRIFTMNRRRAEGLREGALAPRQAPRAEIEKAGAPLEHRYLCVTRRCECHRIVDAPDDSMFPGGALAVNQTGLIESVGTLLVTAKRWPR